jgi:hypothetical protein
MKTIAINMKEKKAKLKIEIESSWLYQEPKSPRKIEQETDIKKKIEEVLRTTQNFEGIKDQNETNTEVMNESYEETSSEINKVDPFVIREKKNFNKLKEFRLPQDFKQKFEKKTSEEEMKQIHVEKRENEKILLEDVSKEIENIKIENDKLEENKKNKLLKETLNEEIVSSFGETNDFNKKKKERISSIIGKIKNKNIEKNKDNMIEFEGMKENEKKDYLEKLKEIKESYHLKIKENYQLKKIIKDKEMNIEIFENLNNEIIEFYKRMKEISEEYNSKMDIIENIFENIGEFRNNYGFEKIEINNYFHFFLKYSFFDKELILNLINLLNRKKFSKCFQFIDFFFDGVLILFLK